MSKETKKLRSEKANKEYNSPPRWAIFFYLIYRFFLTNEDSHYRKCCQII